MREEAAYCNDPKRGRETLNGQIRGYKSSIFRDPALLVKCIVK